VLRFATALEQGRFDGPLARACAAAWARVAERTVVRRFDLPAGTRAVTVGGATLGGSGKTPLAIACAEELAASGAHVALVGHGYRARPRRARVVAIDDSVDEVGDEAIVAARALAPVGVPVIVAPDRRAAIARAARDADVLVLDGVAQTGPARASLALLAVDASMPWGRACAVAPRGDLRAPKDALLAACDVVVAIGDAHDVVAIGDASDDAAIGDARDPCAAAGSVCSARASTASSGARIANHLRTWKDLAGARVGLLSVLARPDRVVRSLERRGIAIRAIVRARDHGPVDARFLAHASRARDAAGVDLWLATSKCALHLAHPGADVGSLLHAPVGVIEHALILSGALRRRLRWLAAP
jgi:tetraacyldisaccharide 4'-kinase